MHFPGKESASFFVVVILNALKHQHLTFVFLMEPNDNK